MFKMSLAPDTFAYYREETVNSDRLWYVLPDSEMPEEYQNDRPSEGGQGWPMTVNLFGEGGETLPLTYDLQKFILSINPGLSPRYLPALLNTWNVFGKLPDDRTWPSKILPLAKFPRKLIFGGNVIQSTTDEPFPWTGGYGVSAETPVLELATLDINDLPFGIKVRDNPHVIHHQTLAAAGVYLGKQKVNPFGLRGGRNTNLPDYTCVVSDGARVYIIAAKTRKVRKAPNPYWPEMDVKDE